MKIVLNILALTLTSITLTHAAPEAKPQDYQHSPPYQPPRPVDPPRYDPPAPPYRPRPDYPRPTEPPKYETQPPTYPSATPPYQPPSTTPAYKPPSTTPSYVPPQPEYPTPAVDPVPGGYGDSHEDGYRESHEEGYGEGHGNGYDDKGRGEWAEWSTWSGCSVTCGDGGSKRTRTCNKIDHKPKPTHGSEAYKGTGGYKPPHDGYEPPNDYQPPTDEYKPPTDEYKPPTDEYKPPTDEYKPPTGEYKPPHGSYPPPANHGGGYASPNLYPAGRKKRDTRGYGDVDFDHVFHGEHPGYGHGYGSTKYPRGCDGPDEEVRPCSPKPCEIDGGWGSWGEWSLCSASCGDGGIRFRNRTCDSPVPQHGGKLCRGVHSQRELCSSHKPCPIDGGWCAWSEWTECSISCGAGGTTFRERSCTEPVPKHGGLPCDGDSKEIRGCCKDPCPIDGAWGPWTAWSLPTASCGAGATVNRTRFCDNPTPAYGGLPCEGISFSVQYVHLPPCPVHGGWSQWSHWGDCSVTCGKGGFKVRNRVCDHPSPLYGGKFCVGDATEATPCLQKPCAIDGGWSSWYGWSSCSATCGFGGRVYRKRYCDHPKPSHNGVQCIGSDTDSKFCFVRHCAINGAWSAWSEWVFNSVTCGEGGSKSRHRYCNNPEPMYGGKNCDGEDHDVIPVQLPECPIAGGWSGWSSWTDASVTCGDGGISTRRRTCTNPKPSNGGANCRGDKLEIRTVDLVPCPVCGGWSEWNEWSTCSKTCGAGGLTSRSRDCTNPTPSYGGFPCTGEPSQTKSCSPPACPVHGGWSGWGEWSLCSATCGDAGHRKRIRNCDNPAPAHNGLHCQGVEVDSKSCTAPACPIDGKWSPWGSWSECSVTCGFGATSTRTRACSSPEPAFGGHSCLGSHIEVVNVTTKPCPVNGGWTDWSEWSRCSVSCGQGGTNTRQRQCTNPPPKFGGENCKGDSKEARFCASKPCAINGDWGAWSEYTSCSVTCGAGGIKTRMRVCDKPAPAYGGVYCPGESSDTVECVEKPCPINGGWGQWGPWSEPSKTCGYDGYVSRTRNCDKPTPQHGGEPCEGESSQVMLALLNPCPVDGGWTSWTGWTLCSVTCGSGGVTKRHRYCENPEPEHGGNQCAGEAVEVRACAAPNCPVDGGWTEWSAWSKCSVTCGEGGWITRVRTCTHPDPQFGGKFCQGSSSETIPGNAPPCAVDGGWGKWNRWSSCSVSCGLGGSRTRTRACDNPTPAFHGKPCNADSTETKNCSAPHCPIDGDWSEWNEWSRCSVTCGDGHQSRHRVCDNPEPQYGGKICTDDNQQTRTCTKEACPIDGGWSSWSEWSDKSVSCGSGAVVARKRLCNNPVPENNGKYCLGPHVEVKNATAPPCVDDGGWSKWCEWSACSVTCGYGGFIKRSRTCTHPAPSPYGKPCVGDHEEKVSCFEEPCPVEGGWTNWCSWSSCSVTCGDDGSSTRTRSCENPLAAHGGHDCVGEESQTQRCSARPCGIDGGWSKWTEWATCSVTCGEKGVTTRTRTCTNPTPDHAGRNCKGVNYETKNCTEPPCPVNGGWSGWSDWAECSQSCGHGGKTTRSRTCTAPAPAHGGDNCKGEASETKHCFKEPCDNWSVWSEWSSCVKKCGVESYEKRVRRCKLPARPLTYGHYIVEWCEGDSAEFRNCSDQHYDYNSAPLATDVEACQGRVATTCFNDWIVVAQRIDNSHSFNKSWVEYKKGFGEPTGNFYIGNENLHCLTRDGKYQLRVDALTSSGEWVHAVYQRIVVASESEKYALTVMDHSGGSAFVDYENGQAFSTYDRDNDKSVYGNCAKIHCGGWWFNACYQTCLTCDYERYFEIKPLGANKQLKKMRVLIRRAPDLEQVDDSYGAELPEFPEQYNPDYAPGNGGYGGGYQSPPVPDYQPPHVDPYPPAPVYPTRVPPSYPPTAPPVYPTEPPAYIPTEPAYKPTEPAYKPTEPAYKPTEPAYKPTQPDYKPAEPEYKPPQPVYKPHEPPYRPPQPDYPPSRPSYPEQPGYPPARPAYPEHPRPDYEPPKKYPNVRVH